MKKRKTGDQESYLWDMENKKRTAVCGWTSSTLILVIMQFAPYDFKSPCTSRSIVINNFKFFFIRTGLVNVICV